MRTKEMIRVLQVVNDMRRAGLETMLMNYYRNIDRTEIQFDFLTHRPFKGAYDDEIIDLSGKVYYAPRLYPQNYIKYFKFMDAFFKTHPEYKIVHSHIDAMSFFPLKAAENSHIPVRIAHSHNTKLDIDLKLPIKYWALKKIPAVVTHRCACGEMAGKFMYPDGNFKIIKNAIDIEKFSFDKKIRDIKRKELGIDNKVVIGHVGRYCHVKNQLFLIDILKYILKKDVNYHLILIGKGEDQGKIEEKINNLNLQNNVSLLIDRADVNELYQCMDIYVMPSLFEGVPVAGIEAQTNGLPCVFSDKISKEVLLTDNISMLELNAGSEAWGEKILNIKKCRNTNAKLQIASEGYDIKLEAEKLQKWYLDLEQGLDKKGKEY